MAMRLRWAVLAVVALGCGGKGEPPTSPPPTASAEPRLAYVFQNRLHVVSLNGRGDSAITPTGRQVDWYAWHGTSEHIAYMGNGALRILDRHTGTDRIVSAVGSASNVTWLDWSPSGSRLLYVEDGDIKSVNASGGSLFIFPLTTDYNGTPVWAPDGQSIVSANFGGAAIYVVAADGSFSRKLDAPAGSTHPRWSPDGRSVAFEGGGGIWIAPVDGSPAHRILFADCWPNCGSNDVYQYPRWSPDGTKLAGIKGPGGGLWVANVDGSGLKVYPATAPMAPLPEWSPDGTRIAYIGGSVSWFDVYTMAPDGSDIRAVSNVGHADLPRWVR